MVIIEGADGTGKTTLARAIADHIGGQYIHCSWHKDWQIETYHRLMLHNAGRLEEMANVPCVIDRWALSEHVYGSVFRGGACYDVTNLVYEATRAYKPLFIFCNSKSAVKNHKKNIQFEMFDNIDEVIRVYDEAASDGRYGNYITYNYEEQTNQEFIQKWIRDRQKLINKEKQ